MRGTACDSMHADVLRGTAAIFACTKAAWRAYGSRPYYKCSYFSHTPRVGGVGSFTEPESMAVHRLSKLSILAVSMFRGLQFQFVSH
jgi:hypothetical protein